MPGRTGRRALLATAAAGLLSGCSFFANSEPRRGELNVTEIIVTSNREKPQTVAVKVEDVDGDLVFSRVYELEKYEYDSGSELDPGTVPGRVVTFTPDGEYHEWEYGSASTNTCEATDVEIFLVEDERMDLNKPC